MSLAGASAQAQVTPSTGDVATSPACRAIAARMVATLTAQPLAPARNSQQRAADAAMALASAAAPQLLTGVGGGVAGGLVSEVLHAARAERIARAEEAQLDAINAVSATMAELDEELNAAGCGQP